MVTRPPAERRPRAPSKSRFVSLGRGEQGPSRARGEFVAAPRAAGWTRPPAATRGRSRASPPPRLTARRTAAMVRRSAARSERLAIRYMIASIRPQARLQPRAPMSITRTSARPELGRAQRPCKGQHHDEAEEHLGYARDRLEDPLRGFRPSRPPSSAGRSERKNIGQAPRYDNDNHVCGRRAPITCDAGRRRSRRMARLRRLPQGRPAQSERTPAASSIPLLQYARRSRGH